VDDKDSDSLEDCGGDDEAYDAAPRLRHVRDDHQLGQSERGALQREDPRHRSE
jgi:hypothetical protein